MKPKKVRIPQPVLHKPSGRDVLFLRQPDGTRKTIYLGPHDSEESRRAYRAVLSDHLAGKKILTARLAVQKASEWPTVGQLCAAFLLHAGRYYVDSDGTESKEVVNFRTALKPLLRLRRDTPTDRVEIGDLEDVRHEFANQEVRMELNVDKEPIPGTGRTRCRNYVNATLRRIKHVFRWGVGQKLVPGTVWSELHALKSVPLNRGGLRESKPVTPITRADVDAVLPFLTPPLAAAIELQWYTGMRPSEALAIRMADIERSDDKPWSYRPDHHKGAWRGHERIVKLGQKAQAVIKSVMKADPRAYLICPRDAARQDTRAAGDRYMVDAYRKAIHRACDKAKIDRWSPHRIRHAAGTRWTLKAGTERARVALGHVDDRMTRHYAKQADEIIAEQMAAEHG